MKDMMKEILQVTAFGLSICAAMIVLIFAGNRNKELPASLTSDEVSWVEFCKYNGYNPETQDEDIINEFLDTWRGSAVEEEVLTRQGVEV